MTLNPTKSIFGVTSGKLIGHIVSYFGICIDPERVIVVQNLPILTSKKEIQSFMGKINFVRRFIPNFANMVKYIHNLMKKDQVFNWTPNTEKTFVDIKNSIVSSHVLEKPDFSRDFIIYNLLLHKVG